MGGTYQSRGTDWMGLKKRELYAAYRRLISALKTHIRSR